MAALVLLPTQPLLAAPILIINGSTTTSEPGTTAAATANLSSILTGLGNTVTVSDGVPGSLAGFSQVWDIRFSNSSPITAGQQAQYVAYLQAGGGLFVVGENGGFATRNTSVLGLINAAGGGSLGFVSPPSTQTVNPPFNLPDPVASVTYAAPGGVNGFGNGFFVTQNGSQGTIVGFAPGDLTNAPAGTLFALFDINFIQNATPGSDNRDLTGNIARFIAAQAVPEPTSLALFGGAALAAGYFGWRRRKPTPA